MIFVCLSVRQIELCEDILDDVDVLVLITSPELPSYYRELHRQAALTVQDDIKIILVVSEHLQWHSWVWSLFNLDPKRYGIFESVAKYDDFPT